MTERAHDDEGSAWERAVPATAAPIVFDFDAPEAEDSPDTDTPGNSTPAHRQRWKVAAATLGAVVLIGGAIVIVSGDDEPAESAAARTVDTLADLPALPALDADDTEATDGANERLDDEPIDSPLSTVDDDRSTQVTPDFSVALNDWTSGRIEVPVELQGLDPMTLVVQTGDGMLTEIDFPSGITRSLALQQPSAGIIVGRSATLVAGNDPAVSNTAAFLVQSGRPPLDVGISLDAFSAQRRPGTDEFLAQQFDVFDDGIETTRILANADTAPWPTYGHTSLGPLPLAPNGDLLVEDGGNVYTMTESGPTLLAPGNLVASSVRHVLTRSCDASRTCTTTLHDFLTGEQRPVELGPTAIGVPFLRSISPDGRFLLDSYASNTGATSLTYLTTGITVDISYDRLQGVGFGANEIWAPDATGFFQQTVTGLEFWNVDEGRATTVPINSIASFGVRNDLTGVPAAPEIDSSADEIDLTIRGVTVDGAFYDIDFNSGVITGIAPPTNGYVGPGARVIADDTALLAVTEDGRSSVRAVAGASAGERIDLDIDTRFSVVRGLGGTGWRFVADGGATSYRQFDVNGVDTGMEIEVDAGLTVVGGDARGGLVAVVDDGSTVVLTADAVELLTNGELLALGARFAVVRECSETACETVRVDRTTSERQPVDLIDTLVAQQGTMVDNTVSPDGNVVIARTDDPRFSRWTITDVAAGTVVTPASSIQAGTAVAWSSDSQFAVFLRQNGLHVYDRAAGEIVALEQAPPLVSFVEG